MARKWRWKRKGSDKGREKVVSEIFVVVYQLKKKAQEDGKAKDPSSKWCLYFWFPSLLIHRLQNDCHDPGVNVQEQSAGCAELCSTNWGMLLHALHSVLPCCSHSVIHEMESFIYVQHTHKQPQTHCTKLSTLSILVLASTQMSSHMSIYSTQTSAYSTTPSHTWCDCKLQYAHVLTQRHAVPVHTFHSPASQSIP